MISMSTNKIKNSIIAKILFKSLHPKRNEQSESAKGGKNNEQRTFKETIIITNSIIN